MMADHERIEELIVARALDGLDPDDERAYERERATHGPDCAECRRLEAEYDEIAGRLAFSLDPEPVDPTLEERLLVRATGKRTDSVAILHAGEDAADRRVRRQRRLAGRRGGAIVRPLVAVAAAFVLFVGGWAIGSMTSDGGGDQVPTDAHVVALEGAQPDTGTLSVAYTPGKSGVYVLGAGLPQPKDGQVYELWMIQDGNPVSGACVVPEADGSVFAFADAELGTTEAMAVTVESSSCPAAPTTEPVFSATIRA